MKIIRFIHKWVGIIIGLFIFTSCLSGVCILIGKILNNHHYFFQWMKILHNSIFIGNIGNIIIGITTFLLVIELISGYLLWWKLAVAQMRVSKLRKVYPLNGLIHSLSWTQPNFIRGSHIAGGFWSGIPLLIMSLTGLTWSFQWYSDLVNSIFNPDGTKFLFHTISNLHIGSFWNLYSQMLWLIASIIGCTLPLTGFFIYFKSLKYK